MVLTEKYRLALAADVSVRAGSYCVIEVIDDWPLFYLDKTRVVVERRHARFTRLLFALTGAARGIEAGIFVPEFLNDDLSKCRTCRLPGRGRGPIRKLRSGDC